MPALPVRTVRVSDDDWAALGAEAERLNISRSRLAAERLGPPSVAQALDTLGVLQSDGGDELVLALAESPKLAAWDRVELSDLGRRLVALSKRWPR